MDPSPTAAAAKSVSVSHRLALHLIRCNHLYFRRIPAMPLVAKPLTQTPAAILIPTLLGGILSPDASQYCQCPIYFAARSITINSTVKSTCNPMDLYPEPNEGAIRLPEIPPFGRLLRFAARALYYCVMSYRSMLFYPQHRLRAR